MKTPVIRFGGLSVLFACSLAVGDAAQLVLITRPGGNSWAFQEAEKVTVNDKDRVRTGSARNLNLRADDYKRLPAEQMLRVGTLRRHADGYLVHKKGADWEPVAPDGANIKSGATTYADLWKSAVVGYQSDRNAKNSTKIGAGDVVFAILPGQDRDQAVVDFIADPANFRGVGEKDAGAAFTERMSLLEFAAQKVHGPSAEKLQQILLARMVEDNQKVSVGLAHKSDLDDGLDYAKVSDIAYPNEPRQKQVRDALRSTNAALGQQTAILRAFAAGGWWDDFLQKYGTFDRWRNSYEDIGKLKEKAFAQSATEHIAKGRQREEAKQWALALNEYKAARLLDPNNKPLDGLIRSAKAADDGESCKPLVVDMKSQPQRVITNYLSDVTFAIQDNKLEEAESKLALAEAQDKASTRVVFSRADLLRAKKEFQPALDLLDNYDRHACSDDEIAKSSQLRSRIQSEFKNATEKLKAVIEKAKTDGDYLALRESSVNGTKLDSQDLDFLHDAAIGSAIVRKSTEAIGYLNDYVARLSLTPGAGDKLEQRGFPAVQGKAQAGEQQGAEGHRHGDGEGGAE